LKANHNLFDGMSCGQQVVIKDRLKKV